MIHLYCCSYCDKNKYEKEMHGVIHHMFEDIYICEECHKTKYKGEHQ